MNNPEYCQGIYEAAQKVVKYCENTTHENAKFLITLWRLISDLKRALEGKET